MSTENCQLKQDHKHPLSCFARDIKIRISESQTEILEKSVRGKRKFIHSKGLEKIM